MAVNARAAAAAKLPQNRVRLYQVALEDYKRGGGAETDAAFLGLPSGAALDGAQMLAASRLLTYVEEELFKSPAPPLDSARVVPRKIGAGGWVRETVYRIKDSAAKMSVVAGTADDYPAASVGIKEQSAKVKPYGNSYSYFLREVLAAARGGINLDTDEAEACMEAYEEKVDHMALFGDAEYDVKGLKSYFGAESDKSKIPYYRGYWDAATTDIKSLSDAQLLDFLNGLFRRAARRAVNSTAPDTLVLPHRIRDYLSERPYGTSNGTLTILQYFLANNPYCRQVIAWHRLLEAGDSMSGSATDLILALPVNPRVLRQQIPDPFRPMAPEQRRGKIEVCNEALIGSVEIIQPQACSAACIKPGTL